MQMGGSSQASPALAGANPSRALQNHVSIYGSGIENRPNSLRTKTRRPFQSTAKARFRTRTAISVWPSSIKSPAHGFEEISRHACREIIRVSPTPSTKRPKFLGTLLRGFVFRRKKVLSIATNRDSGSPGLSKRKSVNGGVGKAGEKTQGLLQARRVQT